MAFLWTVSGVGIKIILFINQELLVIHLGSQGMNLILTENREQNSFAQVDEIFFMTDDRA